MKKVFLLLAIALLSVSAHAQTINAFTLTAQPVALPKIGTTVMGSITGLALTVTPDFDLREDNVLASGTAVQGYFGGFNYRLPVLSNKLNAVSPTLSGSRFQFYITASIGVDRIADAVATAQHYAFLAGGGVNYDLTGSGHFTFGAEVRYAKLPGFANNTAIVSVGPALHF